MVLKIPPPQHRPSERAVMNGPANLQRGIETVGGWLFLTNQRCIFKSHKFNVKKGVTEIALRDIVCTTPCWTRLFNLIPVAPNSLSVGLEDGTEFRFVLNKRNEWKQKIDETVERVKSSITTANSPEITVKDTWERLEQAVSLALGTDRSFFGQPATEEEIASVERELGVEFPADFRMSLLIHNGNSYVPSGPETETSGGPFRHIEFLPLSAIVDEWTTWKNLISQSELDPNADEQVLTEWWNRKWIPLTVIGGATNHHCLDLAPTEIGYLGQVIEIADDNERRIFIAKSYKDFLLKLTAEVETGEYSNIEGSLVHRDWM